jgi:excisionase family DNA binding protein
MIRTYPKVLVAQRERIRSHGLAADAHLHSVAVATTGQEVVKMANPKHNPLENERLLARPQRACYLLDCGTTRLYELIANGELESFKDGRSRKIVVASIHRLIAKRLASEQSSNLASEQLSNNVQRPRRGRPRRRGRAA